MAQTTMRKWMGAAVMAAAMLGWGACGPRAMAGPEDASPTSDALLATRMGELAHSTLHSAVMLPPTWLQAIDLWLAAQKLDPVDSRYPRLLIDAQLEARNVEGAKAALKAYRALEPNDRVAQVQLINLYVSQIQTADAKLKYLRLLLNDTTLPDAVKSTVAVSATAILFERSQDDDARAMLDEALKLNPLNMDALRLRYRHLQTPSPEDRVAVLLDMLRSNPGQTDVIQTLARELGNSGLIDAALEWYGRAVSLLNAQGMALPPDLAREYAIELSIGDQPQLAATMAQQLLQADPSNLDALFVAALAASQNGDATGLQTALDHLTRDILNTLAQAEHAAGDKAATTQPIDTPAPTALPDFSGDVARIKAAAPTVKTAYISALTDLAWTQLYFKSDAPAARKLIDVIRQLVPADNVTLTRLEGWAYLVEKKPGEAKVKLTAVADRDPLAALGMIKLETDPHVAEAAATKLISEHSSGLLGAFLWNATRQSGARHTISARGDQLLKKVSGFPRDWLSVLDQPQKFYAVRFEPLLVGHAFGQPMWAKVTIQNVGDHDLTLGADGVIRPDLWVDAQLRGLNQQPIPAIAYDRLGGYLVLRPNQSTSRILRIDQGVLDNFLKSNPRTSIQLSASVITNPVFNATGSTPGPAGQRAQLNRLIQRNGYLLDDDAAKQSLYEKVTSGTPSERFRNLGLLAAYAQLYRSDDAPDKLKAWVPEFIDVIRKVGNDSDPSVAAWASYLHARLIDDPRRLGAIRDMAKAAVWQKRLLALVAVQSLPAKDQLEIATLLSSKDDIDLVRGYAGAVEQLAKLPTSQPIAKPATESDGEQ